MKRVLINSVIIIFSFFLVSFTNRISDESVLQVTDKENNESYYVLRNNISFNDDGTDISEEPVQTCDEKGKPKPTVIFICPGWGVKCTVVIVSGNSDDDYIFNGGVEKFKGAKDVLVLNP